MTQTLNMEALSDGFSEPLNCVEKCCTRSDYLGLFGCKHKKQEYGLDFGRDRLGINDKYENMLLIINNGYETSRR